MSTSDHWGVELILWLQQFSPTLDLPFFALSWLGNEIFFLVALPLIYWCIDRRLGARLAILFLLSSYLNAVFKVWAGQPRPYMVDERVLPLDPITSGGFPSGHAQNTTALWGYLALHYRRRWLWWVTGALLLLVPLSRLYLGVHFPVDLLGGYVIGALALLYFMRRQPRVEGWLARQSLRWQVSVAALGSLALLWLLPAPDDNGVATAATLLGMGVGFALERAYVRFAPPTEWRQRLICFAVGALPLALIYLGLRLAFAELEPAPFWRYLRYALVGFWAAFGAPWLFVRLGLAGVEAMATTPQRGAAGRTQAKRRRR